MTRLQEVLSPLEEEQRRRVLSWACDRYGHAAELSHHEVPTPQRGVGTPTVPQELAGIAELTPSGDFRLTVRDLKAKSKRDAARRVAYLAIHAYCQLKGEAAVSSRRIVTPLLKSWRAYDGNARALLASDRGIHRDGDALSLDAHAHREAERFMRDVLDPNVSGCWEP